MFLICLDIGIHINLSNKYKSLRNKAEMPAEIKYVIVMVIEKI